MTSHNGWRKVCGSMLTPPFSAERSETMDNNKNRMKDREKSNPELRKMDPGDNADVGIKDGQIIGVHESKHEKRRSNKKGERK